MFTQAIARSKKLKELYTDYKDISEILPSDRVSISFHETVGYFTLHVDGQHLFCRVKDNKLESKFIDKPIICRFDTEVWNFSRSDLMNLLMNSNVQDVYGRL